MESDMTVYGYARVSIDGQSLSELKAAKCAKIFQEKVSGAWSDRKQLTRLMSVLEKGGRIGRYPARSIGQIHARSPQFAGDDRGERGGVQITERGLG
jgi:hypothetical protein